MPTTINEPELLEAASALEPERFEKFVNDILKVRASRTAPTVRADEGIFLSRINAGPPADVWAEYRRLRERLRREELNPAEHAELLRLTDVMEQHQVDRVAALTELASLRGQSLSEVMDALGIHGPATE